MLIHLIVGTRPEAIKMAPLAHALRERDVPARIISTGQHQQVLDEALAIFDLKADERLDIFEHGQGLSSISAKTMLAVDGLLAADAPSALIVQGDTNSAAAAGIAASYRGIPVVHLEAGLRTGVKRNPFPEEINRRLLGSTADLHLAPTRVARQNLVNEGIAPAAIVVTGNTVIDAAQRIANTYEQPTSAILRDHLDGDFRTILATTHRRESWGDRMAGALKALRDVVHQIPDVQLLLATHPNPAVQATVRDVLGGRPRIHVIEPLAYPDFVHALSRCHLVVTDSGGVQEEAPGFARPVLVLRETTERPEGVDAGVARLVGTDPTAIRSNLLELLTDEAAYLAMARAVNPYGDGHAAARAADAIIWFLGWSPHRPTEMNN